MFKIQLTKNVNKQFRPQTFIGKEFISFIAVQLGIEKGSNTEIKNLNFGLFFADMHSYICLLPPVFWKWVNLVTPCIIMIFMDFGKVFNAVEEWAIIDALKRCLINYYYVTLIKSLYDQVTITIRAFDDTNLREDRRGITEGDTNSPNLLTNTLEDIVKTLDWEGKIIKINNESV